MKTFFWALTILSIIGGFIVPMVWLVAPFAAFFAIMTAPGGYRPDGKRKTGGLIGGIIDEVVIANTMIDCPACRKKISIQATRCPHCQETIEARETCFNCGALNVISTPKCGTCKEPLC